MIEFSSKMLSSRVLILAAVLLATAASFRYESAARKSLKSPTITFDEYHHHDEIDAYLKQLSQDYSGTVTLEALGKSYEDREVNAVRISSGTGDASKPVIFVSAGIHAREWAAPASALYLINQLVESNNKDLTEKVDWIVAPLINPDGYEFSWGEKRNWQKTRSLGKDGCNGTDVDRNFDFHWMEAGASQSQCNVDFAGTEPFSEVETRNLAAHLNKTANIKAYVALHGGAQSLFYPWSHDDTLCDDWEELDVLGHAMRDAIRVVRNFEYKVASAGKGVGPEAGTSDDYAKGVVGIDIVYRFELAWGGGNGYDPSVEEMQTIIKEAFEGFKILGNYVAENKG